MLHQVHMTVESARLDSLWTVDCTQTFRFTGKYLRCWITICIRIKAINTVERGRQAACTHDRDRAVCVAYVLSF